MATIKELRKKLKEHKERGAWGNGLKKYAEMMLDRLEINGQRNSWDGDMKTLLAGAKDWNQASYGACYLVYDGDIANILCTPNELKRLRYKEGGWKRPNAREEWLDTQARALHQAANLLQNLNEEIKAEKAKPKAVKLSQPKMTNSKLTRMSRGL